ncbi:hypothetical protein [Paramagnetospirillum magneticum]|uniref:Uncharacterized protein n=1 Tax=Paramagnetospirillum magneticum (strain ATCC 700264 / AMB-1) TaxID=342108 RepID=Q2VZW9_PARM1|nr:hypothetical protein [Paramagnetospirillum magneticum]BAE52856.1 hypothetical protein amb4052 [Paramagnetospirillum magneticum AMB-1]
MAWNKNPRMNKTELAAWRLSNPDYLFPRVLHCTWEPPADWGPLVYRYPLPSDTGRPPRRELLLYEIPPGVTPRRDFSMPFPSKVLVLKAIARRFNHDPDIFEEEPDEQP